MFIFSKKREMRDPDLRRVVLSGFEDVNSCLIALHFESMDEQRRGFPRIVSKDGVTLKRS